MRKIFFSILFFFFTFLLFLNFISLNPSKFRFSFSSTKLLALFKSDSPATLTIKISGKDVKEVEVSVTEGQGLMIGPTAIAQLKKPFTVTVTAKDEDGVIAVEIWDGHRWHSKDCCIPTGLYSHPTKRCEYPKECTFSMELKKDEEITYNIQGGAHVYAKTTFWSSIKGIFTPTIPVKITSELPYTYLPPSPSPLPAFPPTLEPFCFDFDEQYGEAEIFHASKVNAGDFVFGFAGFYDYCLDEYTLNEIKCNPTTKNAYSYIVECPYGTVRIGEKTFTAKGQCKDGKCVIEKIKSEEECDEEEANKRFCIEGENKYKICLQSEGEWKWVTVDCKKDQICEKGECLTPLTTINLPKCPFKSQESAIWAKSEYCSWDARVKLGSREWAMCSTKDEAGQNATSVVIDVSSSKNRLGAIAIYIKKGETEDVSEPVHLNLCITGDSFFKEHLPICPKEAISLGRKGDVLARAPILLSDFSWPWDQQVGNLSNRSFTFTTWQQKNLGELLRQLNMISKKEGKIEINVCELLKSVTKFSLREDLEICKNPILLEPSYLMANLKGKISNSSGKEGSIKCEIEGEARVLIASFTGNIIFPCEICVLP